MPTKLEHALALAEQGYYVFPCDPQTNAPTVPWRERSTRNAETIKNWFICPHLGFEQDFNIGVDCYKSGVTAIDVDVKDGKLGYESFEKLQQEHGWETTRTQITASGGMHLIYKAQGFKNSVERLAPGIDVRGDGGFYIAAGSSKNGKKYILENDIAPKPMPEWLSERLTAIGKAEPLGSRHTETVLTSDNPDDIAAAIEFLKNHEPAVDGKGGDIHTYVTFCHLKEMGVSLETAIEIAEEHWNPQCSPPWSDEELTVKAQSAYRSAQNATGVKSPHAEFDLPKDEAGEKPAPTQEPESEATKKHAFNEGFLLPDAKSFPSREWIYGKLALAKNVTLIIAPPGVGKSTLTLGIGLSKAAGKDIFGIKTLGKGTVAIFNNEDNIEEQSRRLVAAGLHYGITNAEISDAIDGSRILLNGRDNAPLTIAKRNKDGAIVAHQAKELTKYLVRFNVKLLIVDPLAMTHPADENKNEEMLTVGNLYAEVANRANCAVILVHHTRKLNQSSSQGHDGNLDSARGASSLGGVVRVAYTLNVMGKIDAKRYGVEEDNRTSYLLLEQAKANMSGPGGHKMFFERIGVPVGMDDESVGVLKPVNLVATNVKSDIAQELMLHIEEIVSERETSQPELLRLLKANHYATYAELKPNTLITRIKRLFPEGTCTGDTGFMCRKERSIKESKTPVYFISYKPFVLAEEFI